MKKSINSFVFLFIVVLLASSIKAQTNTCQTCAQGAISTSIYTETFSSGSYSISSGNPQAPTLGGIPGSGHYVITNQNANSIYGQWYLAQDHTPTTDNYYLLCDANNGVPTCLFRKVISVVSGNKYIFCAWFSNVTRKDLTGNNSHEKPKFEMRVNGNPIDGSLELENGRVWSAKSITYTANATESIELSIVVTTTNWIGNDVAMDDISITECKTAQPCKCNLAPVKATWIGANGVITNSTLICGQSIKVGNVCVCQPIRMQFRYTCDGTDCRVSSSWTVAGPNGFHVGPSTGSNGLINTSFIPTEAGLYTIIAKVKCENTECECKMQISIDRIIQCRTVGLEREPIEEKTN